MSAKGPYNPCCRPLHKVSEPDPLSARRLRRQNVDNAIFVKRRPSGSSGSRLTRERIPPSIFGSIVPVGSQFTVLVIVAYTVVDAVSVGSARVGFLGVTEFR